MWLLCAGKAEQEACTTFAECADNMVCMGFSKLACACTFGFRAKQDGSCGELGPFHYE